MAPKRGSHLSTNNKIDIVMFSLFKYAFPFFVSFLYYFFFLSFFLSFFFPRFPSLSLSLSFSVYLSVCLSVCLSLLLSLFRSLLFLLCRAAWSGSGDCVLRSSQILALKNADYAREKTFQTAAGKHAMTDDDWRRKTGPKTRSFPYSSSRHWHHLVWLFLLLIAVALYHSYSI